MKSIACTTLLVAGAIGCGAQGGASNGSTPDGTSAVVSSTADGGPIAYLPLAVGLSWTYQITTATGAVSQHQTTVEASEPSPSSQKPSFRIRYELPDALKLEWDQEIGTEVVRYEEHQIDASGNTTAATVYSPSVLVLDQSLQHLTVGATWTDTYMQAKTPSKKGKTTSEQAQWTVQAVDEMVTVPAGTFSCLKVTRVHTTSKAPVPEVTWYAAGVGKVKETGAGPTNNETIELVSMP